MNISEIIAKVNYYAYIYKLARILQCRYQQTEES
jgi:hypothetical protein